MRWIIRSIFFFCLTSVFSEVININTEIDKYLKKWNEDVRNTKDTTFGILSDSIGTDIHYSDGFIYGLDSAARTGDCIKIAGANCTSYDCRLGLKLLLLIFPNVTIGEDVMSMMVRVRNNSIHIAYTAIHNTTTSKVKYIVDAYEVENFEDVELGASVAKYDGIDVNHFFRTTVKEVADKILKETLDDSSEETSEEDQKDPFKQPMEVIGQRIKELIEFHTILN